MSLRRYRDFIGATAPGCAFSFMLAERSLSESVTDEASAVLPGWVPFFVRASPFGTLAYEQQERTIKGRHGAWQRRGRREATGGGGARCGKHRTAAGGPALLDDEGGRNGRRVRGLRRTVAASALKKKIASPGSLRP